MPELPEVETIRSDLEEKITGKKITELSVRKPRLIHGSIYSFKKVIIGTSIKSVDRIGKLLIFELKNNFFLLIHLKMTGQLIYCDKDEVIAGGHANSKKENEVYLKGGRELCSPGKYTHIIFKFNNSSKLFFNDLRQFGYLKIVDKEELDLIKSKYGIEPLQKDFTWKNFKKLIGGRKANIKALILKQDVIAGIGNIYADEVLFAAGILPTRIAASLSEDELKLLFQEIKRIIKKAIKHRGTTFSDYVDSKGEQGNFKNFLKVYGKDKTICSKCRMTKIVKVKIAGRGTRFCPRCQN